MVRGLPKFGSSTIDMNPFKRKSSYGGGGTKFGGKSFVKRAPGGRSGGFGDHDFSKPQLFQSTCAECGEQCEVPFRPNGSKPVLCHRCFKKDGSGFGKPGFSDKRTFVRGPVAGGGQDIARLEKRFDALEVKLDRILREVEAMKEQKA